MQFTQDTMSETVIVEKGRGSHPTENIFALRVRNHIFVVLSIFANVSDTHAHCARRYRRGDDGDRVPAEHLLHHHPRLGHLLHGHVLRPRAALVALQQRLQH